MLSEVEIFLRDEMVSILSVRSLYTAEQVISVNGSVKVNPLMEFAPTEPRFSSLQSSLDEAPGSLKSVSRTSHYF